MTALAPMEFLPQAALSALCPMHLRMRSDGRISGCGRTLARLPFGQNLVGRDFFEVFHVKHPRRAGTLAGLLEHAGRSLKLHLSAQDTEGFAAVAAPDGQGGAIVNLSFGFSIVDAVKTYSLNSGDFSPTDLAIELLYLVEALGGAMHASRGLNVRLQGAKVAAEVQASTDTLTGLKNRRAMDEVLARLLDSGQAFSLIHLDLDYFKQVNDTHGHAAGDAILRQVAHVLQDNTRDGDTVARIGGDEFVILFVNLVDRGRLREISCRLIEDLEKPVAYGAAFCRISASIGISRSVDYPHPKAEQLMEHADIALYASKKAGRAQHRFYEPETPT